MSLRSVILPSEHGGWSLTLEPAILGLLVAPSAAGWVLGTAALLSFVLRAPLKIVLVDRWRGRWLPRSRLAVRAVVIEATAVAVLTFVAIVLAEHAFWWPFGAAVPLVLLALWHDARSRSRNLVAEIAGVAGIGSVAAAIALAGGSSSETAAGLWLIVGARSVAAIALVRVQLLRAKRQSHRLSASDLGQGIALIAGAVGVGFGVIPLVVWAVLAAVALFGVIVVRISPVPAYVVGAQQVVVGLAVVLVAGLAIRAP